MLVKFKRTRIATAHTPAVYHLLVGNAGRTHREMMMISPRLCLFGNVNVFEALGGAVDLYINAAKAANVNHIIEALPKGYRTEISEDSDNISAGEKQLITIARAMVANPPMMILDEATSNVDTRTEQLIQDSFEKLTSGRTSFVIAHRLSTIRNSDLILVMRDGNIVEQGNHDELLKLNGFYAELYNSQFAEG